MRLFFLAVLAIAVVGCGPAKLGQAVHDPSVNVVTQPAPLDRIDAYPGSTEVKRSARDEDGFHILELGLITSDPAEKVRAFYESELKAKAMPLGSGMMSIQADDQGKHYQVDYGRFGSDTTISISVKTPG